MEIAKIAIACFRKDLNLVKACVASIRYWYPYIEIFLIKDISQGDFSTTEIEKSFNVKLFPTHGKKFGWGWGKFALLLGEKKERYLFLDSDVVLLGPVLQELNKHSEEFIVTGMKEENKYNPTINSHYIDMMALESFDPSYQYPGYGFNTGQIVITSGLLTRADCADVVEFEPTFNSKYPHLFKHADQGILNYLLVKASQLNKCCIRYADFWIWPELPEAANISLDNIRSKKGVPLIMHWAGVKPTDFRKIARYDIFKFYEDYYYSKIKLGWVKKHYNYYKRLFIVRLKIAKYTLLKMKYE